MGIEERLQSHFKSAFDGANDVFEENGGQSKGLITAIKELDTLLDDYDERPPKIIEEMYNEFKQGLTEIEDGGIEGSISVSISTMTESQLNRKIELFKNIQSILEGIPDTDD